jgi:predicted amidophosphoribosyltransferase
VIVGTLRKVLTPLAPPACFGCGDAVAPGGALCAGCRAGLGWLSGEVVELAAEGSPAVEAWAPLAYRGGARALAQALKFRGALGVAGTMAAPIAAGAPPGLLAGGVLVPVPLHPARRRRRGFNQAERLARAVADRTGLAIADCLERGGPRGTQMGRDRDERLDALLGAVSVRREATAPPDAILVDDVLTTGVTLLACAAALRARGTRRTVAIAYARTPGR